MQDSIPQVRRNRHQFRVPNRFEGTRPETACPAGQTLGQTDSFRQTAPETWCQSRVCYLPASDSAARTSSLCLAGITPVQTLAPFPAGSIRKVLRDATPCEPSEPYWSTIFLSVSESSLNVRLSLVQNSLWLSVESTLTPRITACCCSYFGRSRWKLCASMVHPGVMSFG